MGRWITDGEQSLSATRTTLGGKAADDARNGSDASNDCEQVAALPKCPTGDGQTNKHGCEEKQTPPSWQLLCGCIAHGVRSRLTYPVSLLPSSSLCVRARDSASGGHVASVVGGFAKAVSGATVCHIRGWGRLGGVGRFRRQGGGNRARSSTGRLWRREIITHGGYRRLGKAGTAASTPRRGLEPDWPAGAAARSCGSTAFTSRRGLERPGARSCDAKRRVSSRICAAVRPVAGGLRKRPGLRSCGTCLPNHFEFGPKVIPLRPVRKRLWGILSQMLVGCPSK